MGSHEPSHHLLNLIKDSLGVEEQLGHVAEQRYDICIPNLPSRRDAQADSNKESNPCFHFFKGWL